MYILKTPTSLEHYIKQREDMFPVKTVDYRTLYQHLIEDVFQISINPDYEIDPSKLLLYFRLIHQIEYHFSYSKNLMVDLAKMISCVLEEIGTRYYHCFHSHIGFKVVEGDLHFFKIIPLEPEDVKEWVL